MANEHRLATVESEVQTIRSEMGGLKDNVGRLTADVKGLGAILGRIEQGVARAQEQQDQRDERRQPNLVAVMTMLVTVISMMVGGSWMISGQLARLDESDRWQERLIWRGGQSGGVAAED